MRRGLWLIAAALAFLYLTSNYANAQKMPTASGSEVFTFLDRTEQESDTWDSNARVCMGEIPARPWPRVVVATSTIALRWTLGEIGLRWGVEWQAQYSFDNGATWNAVSEMSYAEVAREWFFNSTDTGSFRVAPGATVLVSVRLFYLGVPVWGRCNYTLSVHGVAP